MKKEKKEKTKKVLVFVGVEPTKEGLRYWKRKYKGQYSSIRMYDDPNGMGEIALVDEKELWWFEVRHSCNQEGLLPERKFYKIPDEVKKSAKYIEMERSGSCYVSDDGIWYNPDYNEFIIVRTVNNNEEA